MHPVCLAQSAHDALSAHLAILDEHGTILEVNAAWRRFARENNLAGDRHGVGENYLSVCDAASGEFAEGASAMAVGIRGVIIGQHEEFHLEYPCHGPGEQRWFIGRATRFVEDGVVRVVVVHENITARKRAEVVLQTSERRLQMALLAGGLGVFEHTPHDDHIIVSREFCQIVGLPHQTSISRDEWIGRMHAEDRGQVLADVRRMLAEQSALDLEYRLCLPDGKVRWIRVTASPVAEQGKVERVYGVVQDITERKESESGLRQLSRVIEHCPVSVVIADGAGRIEYVNPRFCATTGYSFEEVRGKNPRMFKSGGTSAETYRQMWSALTAGREWSGEFHNRKKSGELFLESASISPVRDDKGNLTHFVAVKEDITARRKVEAALRESEERYRSLFERSLDCMYVHDFEGNFLDANLAAFALLGYQRADLASLTFGSLVIPADIPRVMRVVEEVRARGAQADLTEFALIRKDGSHVEVEVKGSLVLRDGQPYAVQGMARDITERKRAGAALKAQLALRELLAKTAANAPGVIFTFRLRPDGSSCMPYASLAIKELFGVQPEEWAEDAAPLFALIHPDDRAGVIDSIAESAGSMLRWQAEFRVQHPAKGTFWIEGQSTPERETDGSTLWHGFMSDITECKRTAQQLVEHKENDERSRRALEHEQELNQIKSRFVSLVSHEFRSPLCVISLAATMLESYRDQMTGEERAGSVGEIQRAVVRMTQMMEGLLIHEKLGAGKMECNPARVDVAALCRRLISQIRSQAGACCSIKCIIDPSAGEAFLDENILLHILANLLGNAVKYSRGDQPATLEVKRLTAERPTSAGTEARPADRLQLRISDSGIGIPATDLPKLFQTFHRATNVGNRPGTGMGLAIVKQCVDVHGGTIRVESEVGVGTTVWVWVPITSSDPQAMLSPDERAAVPSTNR